MTTPDKSKNVVVFGGSGFLGSKIVEAARREQLRATVASRHPEQASDPGSSKPDAIKADIHNDGDVERAIAGATAVVNAISLYAEKGGATFDSVHVRGAERIANYARAADVDILIHVSGIGVDPDSPSKFIRARAQGEYAVQQAFERSAIIRPSVIFGPNDSFLKNISQAAHLPLVPLFGSGETRLQPVYIDDVAAAIVRLMTTPSGPSQVFELGGPKQYSYRDIVALVMAYQKLKRPLLPLPFPLWKIMSAALEWLPSPPLTRDQVILMQSDNVVSGENHTFTDLGITPHNFEDMLPTCLPRG